VGSIGEVVAAEALGLTLHPPSYPGHDAFDADGDVQIKMTGGESVSLYATCDRLEWYSGSYRPKRPRSYTTVTESPRGTRLAQWARTANAASASSALPRSQPGDPPRSRR
jgi:hypothetical protein